MTRSGAHYAGATSTGFNPINGAADIAAGSPKAEAQAAPPPPAAPPVSRGKKAEREIAGKIGSSAPPPPASSAAPAAPARAAPVDPSGATNPVTGEPVATRESLGGHGRKTRLTNDANASGFNILTGTA
eukprot:tig00021036_g17278.t1